jgi:hypothetical protein
LKRFPLTHSHIQKEEAEKHPAELVETRLAEKTADPRMKIFYSCIRAGVIRGWFCFPPAGPKKNFPKHPTLPVYCGASPRRTLSHHDIPQIAT